MARNISIEAMAWLSAMDRERRDANDRSQFRANGGVVSWRVVAIRPDLPEDVTITAAVATIEEANTYADEYRARLGHSVRVVVFEDRTPAPTGGTHTGTSRKE